METRYQRVAREQRERQAARAARYKETLRKTDAETRKKTKQAKDAQRERTYLDAITSDHDHSMDH